MNESMNRTTIVIVQIFAVVFAVAGMSHGFFELLQGNTPTNGVIVEAIGQSHQAWANGGETAFTLLPNFLLAGSATIGVSIAIILWSVYFIDTKHGATGFLVLFVLLFLSGGGIGQVPFFLVAWAFATRINKPLTWWQKVLPESVRTLLAKVWWVAHLVGSVLFLSAMGIAISGYVPNMTDPDQMMNVVFSFLGIALLCYILAFVAGFARDIQLRSESAEPVPSTPQRLSKMPV